MLCPSCGQENREDASFCGECGALLAGELVCAGCGRPNPLGRKFCDGCGQRLAEAAPPTPTPTIPTSFAAGRYQVKRFLDEGGRKRVYLAPDKPFDWRDVYPWRFNRALSYVRRPLLMRVACDDTQVVWGNRHVRAAGVYLIELYTTGRLKAQSAEMKRAITAARQQESGAFNDLVADLFGRCPGLKIRKRVKKIGRQPVGEPGRGLGDIDVLAANPARRRLVLVECKDLAVARTPHELANELQTLFLGRKKKKAVVELHQSRAAWVEEHLADILQFLCLPKEGRWEVAAIVVVDEEISSPYVYKAAMPVLSVRRLEQEFLPDWSGG